jgi:uncharacterized protein YjiS (DUF1127 family)
MSTMMLAGLLAGFLHIERHAQVEHRAGGGFGAAVRQRLARAWRNFTARRDLAALDDRMLKDLGISRAQAHFEANRPVWR